MRLWREVADKVLDSVTTARRQEILVSFKGGLHTLAMFLITIESFREVLLHELVKPNLL